MLTLPHGRVEATLVVPDAWDSKTIALLGHPHSLQGGSMTNKVVTTLARTFRDLSVPSLRFNFRGVGQSDGVFDNGAAESEDMCYLATLLQSLFPADKPRDVAGCKFILAGFSFGSYVTYSAAEFIKPIALISIAPPVTHYNYQSYHVTMPWIVVQGDEDEVIASSIVYDFFEKITPPVTLLRFENTTHYFHGQLVALRERLMPEIAKILGSS